MKEHAELKPKKRNHHQWVDQIQSFDKLIQDKESKEEKTVGIKLGWVKGVLVPCLLSIWGVMLFLRMPWILGQAGIFNSLVIIFISLIIILVTTFSMSAISTNGKIRGGGLYFIISRSIGPEFGASIGFLLAFANTISAAMNTMGFCTSLKSLLNTYNIHILDSNFNYRGLGVISIIFLSILCCIGMDREAEVQNGLLIAIIVGIFNVIIGSIIGPKTETAKASGFTGLNMETFKKNWNPDYRPEKNVNHSFFTIFSIFFPSVTGIQAGANISGDLKDPSSSIPKGTLLSILITITSYVLLIVIPGSVQLREASGNPKDLSNDLYLNCTYINCTKGFYADENLMQSISLWPITIYFGCFGATISTALTALISVPKLLQKMGQDDVYPFLKYLAKGYGFNNEPYRAHLVAMFISSILVSLGDLDKIAPIISTIYLAAYALLNFCTFHVAHYKPLGWRPTYKFYNKWLSLAGSIVCAAVIISIDRNMSAIVGCAICILYKIAARKKQDLNWGSSKQTQKIKSVINNVYHINKLQYHVKNYLPNVMVLSGKPQSRKKLISLGHLITKDNGVQICVNVEKRTLAIEEKKKSLLEGIQWLKNAGIKSLYTIIDDVNLDVATHMVYNCGHGQLRTNIVLIGYKSDWLNYPHQDLQSFLNVFYVANMNEIATIMVRVSSTESLEIQNTFIQDFKHINNREKMIYKTTVPNSKNRNRRKVSDCFIRVKDNEFSFINNKHFHGTIDVWWLYDDEGLALLIAHIIKSSSTWKNCKLRIFGVTDKIERLYIERIKLRQVLLMYRINFDYVDIVLENTTNSLTISYFNSLLKLAASKKDLLNNYNTQKENIANTLFLRDLIEEHSFKSDLIILSTPRTNEEIDILFMCWIDTITRGLPPCIIINGSTGPVFTSNA